MDGAFELVQCHENSCWCADANTGEQLPQTEKGDADLDCEKSDSDEGSAVVTEKALDEPDSDDQTIEQPEDGTRIEAVIRFGGVDCSTNIETDMIVTAIAAALGVQASQVTVEVIECKEKESATTKLHVLQDPTGELVVAVSVSGLGMAKATEIHASLTEANGPTLSQMGTELGMEVVVTSATVVAQSRGSEEAMCGRPVLPDNAEILREPTEYPAPLKSEVEFKCRTSVLNLVGNNPIVCTEEGWTDPPTCQQEQPLDVLLSKACKDVSKCVAKGDTCELTVESIAQLDDKGKCKCAQEIQDCLEETKDEQCSHVETLCINLKDNECDVECKFSSAVRGTITSLGLLLATTVLAVAMLT